MRVFASGEVRHGAIEARPGRQRQPATECHAKPFIAEGLVEGGGVGAKPFLGTRGQQWPNIGAIPGRLSVGVDIFGHVNPISIEERDLELAQAAKVAERFQREQKGFLRTLLEGLLFPLGPFLIRLGPLIQAALFRLCQEELRSGPALPTLGID
jgi:hypothetical protein